jgi:RND family efflux transporter MFP subunit
MKKTIQRIIVALILILLVVALVRIRAMRIKQYEQAPKVAENATPVQVASLQQGSVADTITEQGIITAETESVVGPQIMARCLEVYKHEGDFVHAGEVIARLDNQELQNAHEAQIAEMDSAQGTVQAQRAEINRAREDMASRMSDVQAAKASLDGQKSDINAAMQSVASQEASVEQVRATLAGAVSAEGTQRARTARDKILYENKAISLEQWEASQTAETQATSTVAAIKQQIKALESAVNASKDRVRSLQNGVQASMEHIQSLQKMVNDAGQRVVSQQKVVESAKQKVRALANYAALGETRLGYAVLRAPYDAYITARLAEPGDLMAPGQPIYRVLKPGSVKVMVNIPQESMPMMRIGTLATLNLPQGPMNARVSRVYPSLTKGSLGTVEIDLPKAPAGLKSGSTLDVSIQVHSGAGIIAPTGALLDSNRGSFIYVVKDNKLRLEQVSVDVRGDTQSIIRGNVQAGDEVVVAQSSELMAMHDGQKVIVTPAQGGDNAIR